MSGRNLPEMNSRTSGRPISNDRTFYEVRRRSKGGRKRPRCFLISFFGPYRMAVRFCSYNRRSEKS